MTNSAHLRRLTLSQHFIHWFAVVTCTKPGSLFFFFGLVVPGSLEAFVYSRKGMAGWIAKREGQPKPFLARFRAPGGRTISKAFSLKREAKAWLSEQSVRFESGELVDRKAVRGSFGERADRWLDDRDIRPNTKAKYRSYFDNQLARFADRPINSITTDDVRELVRDLKKDYAADTIRTAYNLLGAVLEGAGLRGVMPPKDERRRVVPKPGPQRHPDTRFLTRTEFDRLSEALPDEYRAMAFLGAFGGLRWGEVAGLSPRDLNAERRTLRVSSTLIQPSKGIPYRATPKTAASRRTISLGNLAGIVEDHIKDHAKSGWMFPDSDGGPLRGSNWRRRVWTPATESAGLTPPRLRFHDLRHTCAAWLIDQGEPVLVVQKRLGHASPTVTLSVYGDLFPGVDEAAADRLTEGL